jgi:Cu-processing system permease protein
MNKIWTIALNSFRENIRDRILYNLLVFALLMIVLTIALVQLSTGEWERITIDVGLSSVSIFGSLMAIFLGVSLVSKEIEKRTIYTLLSKPVSRTYFLFGKYAGMLLTILVNIAIMIVVYVAVLYYLGGRFSWAQAQALILIFISLMILVAIALFFSTFSTPTLSAIFTLSLFVIGHLTADVKYFSGQSGMKAVEYLGQAVYYLLPNLSNYEWIDNATYAQAMPPGSFGIVILLGIVTAALILALASLVLEKRDFV